MPRHCASCEIPVAFLPRPWTHATVKDETPPRNSWPQGMYTAFPKPFTGDSQPGKEFGQAQIAYTNQTFELGGKDESEGYSEAKNVRRGGWVLRHGHAWSFGGDVHAEPADCCVRRFRRVSHRVDDTAGGSCHHQGSAGHHRPRAAVRRRGPELQSAGRYSLTAMIVPYARPNVLTITCPAKWLPR